MFQFFSSMLISADPNSHWLFMCAGIVLTAAIVGFLLALDEEPAATPSPDPNDTPEMNAALALADISKGIWRLAELAEPEIICEEQPRQTIAPLTEAEIEASAVLGEAIGTKAMGIELPSPAEIKARQEAIANRVKGAVRRKPGTRKKQRSK